MLGSPVPKAQDEREDLVGQRRRSCDAPGAGAGLAGVRDRRRAEAAHERRRRRRAAGEAQVAEAQELHDGLAHVPRPRARGFHGREKVDRCLPVRISSRPPRLCKLERSLTSIIAKTKRSTISQQDAH